MNGVVVLQPSRHERRRLQRATARHAPPAAALQHPRAGPQPLERQVHRAAGHWQLTAGDGRLSNFIITIAIVGNNRIACD